MIDDSGQIDVIFLDLNKLKLCFPCSLVKWIISYLELRAQFVDLSNLLSFPPRNFRLLFLNYINDMTTCINQDANSRLFSDDFMLFKTINNANDQITSLDGILT